MIDKFLSFPQIQKITGGKSRVTIWRWEKTGQFPKSHKIGANSVAWLASEVNEWMQSKMGEENNV